MTGEMQSTPDSLQVTPLRWRRRALEISLGVAITLGMASLWALENVRNSFFRLLDQAKLKPRPRPASAFPPGRPRKLKRRSIQMSSGAQDLGDKAI
jgi:hypothetical protein